MKRIIKNIFVMVCIISLVIVNPFFDNWTSKTIYASQNAVVISTNVNIRSGAGTNFDIIAKLSAGDRITIVGEKTDTSGKVWYQFDYNGKTAFIRYDFVRKSVAYTYDANFESKLTANNIPEDYKDSLRALHAEYPNFEFLIQEINMNFDDVVNAEMQGTRSLVNVNSISSFKSTEQGKYDWTTSKWPSFDGANWVCASRELVAYYLDPRNFLYDPYIFQFEEQTFNPNLHTIYGVNEMVKDTFLANVIDCEGNGISDINNINDMNNMNEVVPIIVGEQNNNINQINNDFSRIDGPFSYSNNVSNETNDNLNKLYESSGPINSTTNTDVNISNNNTEEKPSLPISGNNTNNANNANNANGVSSTNNQLPHKINNDNSASSDSYYGPGINNYQNAVIPMLKNNKKIEGKIVAFSNIIIPPGVSVSNENNNSTNVANNYISNSVSSSSSNENSSYNFTYLSKGTHTYSEIIFDACKQVGINPYVVVAMLLQEQGLKGTSDSISGTNQKFPGYYNFGNIGSFASDGYTAVENGLKYAMTYGSYGRPWNTKEKAIYGVIDYYANTYIKQGQDTFYLKKWNVVGDSNNLFKHQYMTNVQAGASEGKFLSDAYNIGIKQMTHIFKIPHYRNMPSTPAKIPTKDGSPNNKLKSLEVTSYVLTPTFDMDINDYSLIVDANTNSINVNAVKYDANAKVDGIGKINLNSQGSKIYINVTAGNGDVRQYSITIYKQGGINNNIMPNNMMPNNMDISSNVMPIITNDGFSSSNIGGPPISNSQGANIIDSNNLQNPLTNNSQSYATVNDGNFPIIDNGVSTPIGNIDPNVQLPEIDVNSIQFNAPIMN